MISILKKTSLMIMLALPVLFMTSCGSDDSNRGNLDDALAEAYRDNVLAVYDVFETCESGNYTYDVTITASSSSDDGILIANLYDQSQNIDATIDETTVTIPNQIVDGLTYQGSGELDGDELTLSYTVTTGAAVDVCQATATKK